MKTLLFKSSPLVSIGVELEFQIANSLTYDLISRACDLLRNVNNSHFNSKLKRVVTQSMIEINSSIHLRPFELENEFGQLHDYLLSVARQADIKTSGGSTHLFETGSAQKIFPAPRLNKFLHIYHYFSKRSTRLEQQTLIEIEKHSKRLGVLDCIHLRNDSVCTKQRAKD
jgi:carboxylate-amine ligase